MFNQYRIVSILFSLIFLSILLMLTPVHGQPIVQLIMEPPDKLIYIGLEPQQIWIFPRTDERNVQFEWKSKGPGELKIEEGGVGGIYNVPDHIDGLSAEVVITVTVTNNKGETTTDSVTFTLKAIPPTPTPTPIPITIRQVHLKDAETSLLEPTYSVKPGETITITTDITKPSDSNVTVKYSTIYGKIVPHKQGITYTAPDNPGGRDIVTVKVVDGATNKLILPKIIKIKILNIPR